MNPASFKDPSGFVFEANGKIHRQVNRVYGDEYDLLMSSGLYERLVEQRLLISHVEIEQNITQTDNWYKTLLPDQVQ